MPRAAAGPAGHIKLPLWELGICLFCCVWLSSQDLGWLLNVDIPSAWDPAAATADRQPRVRVPGVPRARQLITVYCKLPSCVSCRRRRLGNSHV